MCKYYLWCSWVFYLLLLIYRVVARINMQIHIWSTQRSNVQSPFKSLPRTPAKCKIKHSAMEGLEGISAVRRIRIARRDRSAHSSLMDRSSFDRLFTSQDFRENRNPEKVPTHRQHIFRQVFAIFSNHWRKPSSQNRMFNSNPFSSLNPFLICPWHVI
jgi:hypothetical protein